MRVDYYTFTVLEEIIDSFADQIGEDIGGCEREGEDRWNLVNSYQHKM